VAQVLPNAGSGLPDRRILDRHGIRILVKQTGDVGEFDGATLLVSLTSSLGLLAVASTIVDMVMTSVLPLRHIYAQYKKVDSVDVGDLELDKDDLAQLAKKDVINPPPPILTLFGVDEKGHIGSSHRRLNASPQGTSSAAVAPINGYGALEVRTLGGGGGGGGAEGATYAGAASLMAQRADAARAAAEARRGPTYTVGPVTMAPYGMAPTMAPLAPAPAPVPVPPPAAHAQVYVPAAGGGYQPPPLTTPPIAVVAPPASAPVRTAPFASPTAPTLHDTDRTPLLTTGGGGGGGGTPGDRRVSGGSGLASAAADSRRPSGMEEGGSVSGPTIGDRRASGVSLTGGRARPLPPGPPPPAGMSREGSRLSMTGAGTGASGTPTSSGSGPSSGRGFAPGAPPSRAVHNLLPPIRSGAYHPIGADGKPVDATDDDSDDP